MKKLVILFLIFNQLNGAEMLDQRKLPAYNLALSAYKELWQNFFDQRECYREMALLSGIAVNCVAISALKGAKKPEVDFFTLSKTLSVSVYVYERTWELEQEINKLQKRARRLAQENTHIKFSEEAVKASVRDHFLTGFMLSSIAHLPLKLLTSSETIDEIDTMVTALGATFFMIKNRVNSVSAQVARNMLKDGEAYSYA
jgi:hypothetical protein